METILFGMAALACPIGMGLMMWFMARGTRSKEQAPVVAPSYEALREEHLRLGAELERLEDAGVEP